MGRAIAALVLLLLLLVLGGLQFRWIGEISRAEAHRRQAQLHQAAQRIASDLQFEVASELARLDPLPPSPSAVLPPVALRWPAEKIWLSRRWRRWLQQHPEGSLLAGIAVIRHAGGRVQLYGWNAPHARLERRPGRHLRHWANWKRATLVMQPLPAFGPVSRRAPVRRPAKFLPRGWWSPHPLPPPRLRAFALHGMPLLLAVRLQPAFLRQILPQLLARELGRPWRHNYRAALYTIGPRRQSLFQTQPAPQPGPSTIRQILLAPWGSPLFRLRFRRRGARRRTNFQFMMAMRDAQRPAWLIASSRGGIWSLWLEPRVNHVESLVASERWRNLGLSLGILAVLAASLVLLALESRRARQLAARQMDFVAGITHELRTPLAVMAAAGDNLADGVVLTGDAVRQHGEAIRRQARRLTRMIEQILEFAALKSGKREYRLEPVLLSELLEEVAAQCRGLLAESGAVLRLELASSLPPVNADRAALGQALQNLIGNALKFGGQGVHIEISAALDPQPGRIRLVVGDSGPGIPAGELKQIFEPFFRGAQARARQIRGSGLGLSLVRQAVLAMGGRVWVESGPGSGSRFCLQLPLAGAEV